MNNARSGNSLWFITTSANTVEWTACLATDGLDDDEAAYAWSATNSLLCTSPRTSLHCNEMLSNNSHATSRCLRAHRPTRAVQHGYLFVDVARLDKCLMSYAEMRSSCSPYTKCMHTLCWRTSNVPARFNRFTDETESDCVQMDDATRSSGGASHDIIGLDATSWSRRVRTRSVVGRWRALYAAA